MCKDKKKSGLYSCSLCNRIFFSPVSLGGHTSKAHPAMSQNYKRKQEVRKKRAAERLLLNEAKAIFKLKTGLKPENNRHKVAAIKNTLRIKELESDITSD